jgi:hypothetical protein
MMRRLAFLIGALSLLFAPARVDATMTCSPTNVSAMVPSTASTTAVVSMPTSAPANATLFLGILNRSDETTTISTVAGDVNTTGWVASAGSPADSTAGTARTWLYYKVGATTGTDTVTVTFSGAINSQVIAGWCSDDSGNAQTHDATATVLDGNGTNYDSNTISAAGAGGIVGFVGGNQTAAWTADGAGETIISGDSAGQRCEFVFEAYASAGTYGFETTAGASTAANFHVAGFLNPAGGTPPKTLLLMGVGPQ